MSTIFLDETAKVKDIKAAISDLKDAVSILNKTYKTMQKTVRVPCAEDWLIFDVGSSGNLDGIVTELTQIRDKAERALTATESGFALLRDTDASFKHRLVDRSWFSRERGFTGYEPPGLLWSLFGKKQNSNTVVKPESGTEMTTPQIENEIPQSKFPENLPIDMYTPDGVQKGRIRYISQNHDPAGNGWNVYDGSGECGYASQCMAMSYIGVNVSPGDLLHRERELGEILTYFSSASNYGYDCDVVETSGMGAVNISLDTINSEVNAYLEDNGQGNVSPVVIHYNNGVWHNYGVEQHTVVIIDFDASTGEYTVLDPASHMADGRITKHKITIDANGHISQSTEDASASGSMAHLSNGNPVLDAQCQYRAR